MVSLNVPMCFISARSARSIVAEVFKPQAYSNLMYSQRYMSPSEYKPLHGRATGILLAKFQFESLIVKFHCAY